ncbi:MAG TPA: Ig-like domain-containing protein, partial [Longimicrobiales bacterium]|nr:Ig-like domain-containing protein [Longimicrobiales bacterium]
MRKVRRTSLRASQCWLRLPTLGLFLAAALASACETSTVSVVEVSEVEVSPSRITLLEGDRKTATVALRATGGAELSGRAVEWTVDDPEVATVSSEGVVEGQAPGQTSVHAVSEGVRGSAEVTVLAGPEIEVSSLTIDFDASADDSGVITRDVEVRNAGNGTLSGLTTRVSGSGGASTAWLDTELVGSSAPTKLRLHVRAKGLKEGSYEARAIVQSLSARNGAAEVRVRLTVIEPEGDPEEEPDAEEEADPDPDPEPGSSCDIRDRTIEDDVEIPRNTTCTFTNVRVRGDVELRR